uniref:Transmembrane protein 158 n=1 Tax=Geotrypetes seraphini TaxID=260995 RepID=A0A6P8QUQ1_GEOSA|nr:transmembrane protein 158 [Geotrypetes seraphini]
MRRATFLLSKRDAHSLLKETNLCGRSLAAKGSSASPEISFSRGEKEEEGSAAATNKAKRREGESKWDGGCESEVRQSRAEAGEGAAYHDPFSCPSSPLLLSERAMLRGLLAMLAVSAAACSILDLQSPPSNASRSSLEPSLQEEEEGAEEVSRAALAEPLEPTCNVSVQRLLLTSLLVRWSGPRLGFQCDLLLFSTAGPGRAAYTAAYLHAAPPLLIEHPALPGPQQELRLCVGCGRLGGGGGHRRGHQHPPHLLHGERRDFCCLDFNLEELKSEQGWRLNRKPIESTLVACFMTLVIIVWSVAALIWPVPIIAGFLPNGMEQRRTSAK